jgi:hypothetical protein
MRTEHYVEDPLSKKISHRYVTRDDKENRLFEALQLALKDQCPPDNKDYLCMYSESEEQDCERCILRWATKGYLT